MLPLLLGTYIFLLLVTDISIMLLSPFFPISSVVFIVQFDRVWYLLETHICLIAEVNI